MLRRARVAKVRQSVTNSFATKTSTTTTVSRRQPGGFIPNAAPQSPQTGSSSRTPRSRAAAPSPRELPASPQPRTAGENRMPTPEQGQAFDQAHANTGPRANEQPRNQQPTGAPAPAAQSAAEQDQARAREEHKKNYRPQPPLQMPPAATNTGAPSPADQDREAADRQVNAADQTNDYAAQARARGAAQRAAKNAKKAAASGGEGDEGGIGQQAAGWVYSLIFQGGGAADELCISGGIVASVAETGNLYQTLLTFFPAFGDKMNASFIGPWLPQKFDVQNTRNQPDLFHFGEFCKGIAAAAEMSLYLFFIILLPVVLAIGYLFITEPTLTFKMLLSA